MFRHSLVALGLALSLTSTASAQTQRERDEARRHYEAGRAATQAGEHERAAQEFQSAFDLVHDPSLLYNIGVAWENNSDWARAMAAYRAFLERVPTAPNRAEVERHIRALEAASTASQRPTQPEPPPTPPPETTPTPPVTVTPPVRQPPQPPPTRSPVPLIVAGAGGVFLVAGAVLGGVALGARSDLVDSCGPGGPERCLDTRENQSQLNLLRGTSFATDILLGVGLAASVGGVLWYFLSTPTRRTAASAQGVRLGVSHQGVSLQGTF